MDSSKIWSTELVNWTKKQVENGEDVDKSCFCQYDMALRRANINFKYTQEEQEEIIRCANDIIYFADKYAFSMTDDGIQKITLRPYQRKMLKHFQDNRFVVMCASRQVGKCLFLSKIYIKKDGEVFETSINELYFMYLEQKRKLTLIEKVIRGLYRLYEKLS